VDENSTLGTRLRRLRRERTISREELAARAGISAEMVAKTEQGTRYPRYPVLARIAEALDVPVSELADRRPRLGGGDGASVLALRDVILSPSAIPGMGSDDEEPEPLPLRKIRAAVDDATASYWDGDLARLAAVLPGLIRSARAAQRQHGAAGAEPLALAYDQAAALLVHLGKEDIAAMAAERAIAAAAQGDDERLHATMQGTYAWTLLHQGRLAKAEAIAADAAARIEPSFTAPELSVAAYGSLLMTALGPAAAAGRDVDGYIRTASAAAERIGHRVRVWGTSFAAATVHMQATYAYAVQREPAKALKSARRLELADLPGTISRGRHLLDVAQAHVDARHGGAAVAVLSQARQMAPVWFRHQGVARQLVSELLERQQRLTRPLRELAAATDAEGYARYYRPAG
jgi:transcriptional regulator with XRE-family HTH domain